MNKKRKIIKLMLILMLSISIYCFIQNTWIQMENIKIRVRNLPSKLVGFKIAHISDVHLRKNEKNIDTIIKKIKQENVDIILITGDIIDKRAVIENSGLNKLSKELSQIAPTFAVTGNHEFWNGSVEKWKKILEENNVEVMDDKVVVYEGIAIAGLSDNSHYKPDELEGIEDIEDMPMILLAHRPELIEDYISTSNKIIPHIIFCGHAHGGQFRIPILNKGIVAPGQGMFPKYTSGLYKFDKNAMIVSRGIGNSIIPVRIHNRPHLPIVELLNQ